MTRSLIGGISAVAVALVVPQSASADFKDVLIGGVAGAIITEAVRDGQQKRRARQATHGAAQPAAPSLNGSYTRAERRQIQSALQMTGYPVGIVDGVLGANSRSAIAQFQARVGEPATGQLTRAQFQVLLGQAGIAPAATHRPLLTQEVVLLQQGLQRLGYYHAGIDGQNGPGTQGATANFLAAQGWNPVTTPPVQAVVLVANTAAMPVPPYLAQEASATATVAAQPFGAPAGTAPGAFGASQQPQVAAGAPAFGAAPIAANAQPGATAPQQPATTQPLFGAAPQQGQVPPPDGSGGQMLIAPAPEGGQTVTPQPQPQVAPAPGTQSLFASGTATVAPTTAQPVATQASSTLDIFSPTLAGGAAPAGDATVAQPQPAETLANDSGTLLFLPASN